VVVKALDANGDFSIMSTLMVGIEMCLKKYCNPIEKNNRSIAININHRSMVFKPNEVHLCVSGGFSSLSGFQENNRRGH